MGIFRSDDEKKAGDHWEHVSAGGKVKDSSLLAPHTEGNDSDEWVVTWTTKEG